jgi:hypothetical protein
VDLTGVRGPGTRLVVDLTDHPKAVAEIAAVADETGLPLASIATYSQEHERLAIVRVDTDNPLPLVQALGEKGFRVVHLAALPAAPNRKKGAEQVRPDSLIPDRQADVRSVFGVDSRPQ